MLQARAAQFHECICVRFNAVLSGGKLELFVGSYEKFDGSRVFILWSKRLRQ